MTTRLTSQALLVAMLAGSAACSTDAPTAGA
jgi:hypothetical protein